MGLQFKEIVVKKEISVKELKGKILAVDSMNLLYQFLTTIRGPDGAALTDSHGKVTSHLIGLFYRTTSLMEEGLKLAFVFDGKAPAIKIRTWEKRSSVKAEAMLKLKEATEAENYEDMRKFASRTAVLSKEMIEEAKKLLRALGCPVVEAPSEGEAETAYLVRSGRAYASVSQDYDNLIFGCPLVVRNLSVEGKRRKTGTFGYEKVNPEQLSLAEVLDHLKIDLDQLIVLAILAGTDYNPGGVKGIGPKKGLKLVQLHGHDFAAVFDAVEWGRHWPDLKWKDIFDTIKNIPVADAKLEWKSINEAEVRKLLVEEHDFGPDRVNAKLESLKKSSAAAAQKGLGSFF